MRAAGSGQPQPAKHNLDRALAFILVTLALVRDFEAALAFLSADKTFASSQAGLRSRIQRTMRWSQAPLSTSLISSSASSPTSSRRSEYDWLMSLTSRLSCASSAGERFIVGCFVSVLKRCLIKRTPWNEACELFERFLETNSHLVRCCDLAAGGGDERREVLDLVIVEAATRATGRLAAPLDLVE